MGGEEADNFFSLEDLNADYGRKYRRTKLWNGNKENVVVDFAVADRCGLSSSSIRSTTTGMLTESTPNIVRLLGKRTKLGDLHRSGNFNKMTAECSNPIVTPRSNSRGNYMNPPEEETRSTINDVSLNGREPLNQKGKENYLGFGRELFTDEIVTNDEEESNDFIEDCLSGSHDGDDEDSVNEINSECNLTQSRRVRRRVIPEEYASLGAPTTICSKCQARMWKEERVNKNVTKGCPIFSLCCMKGAVRLPPIPPTPQVVRGIITMLDEINQLVGEFRQQRDLYENDEIVDLQITLKVIRSESRRECHICSTDEVVGIMVGDTEETCGDRDIVVNEKSKGLVRVSYIHPKLMALQHDYGGFVLTKLLYGINCTAIFVDLLAEVMWTLQIPKMMEYVPGCIAPNCPDIISRVFRLKLEQLMGDIKDKKHFGVCIGGDKNYTFRANEALGKVASREKNKFSKLETFFNSVDVNARKYPYDEIPRFYVWNDSERRWSMRKCGFQIGRLCYAHHSTGEPWFLRLLLTKVRGATSFESLWTINGVCYSIFCDACKEYVLLDDDKEWYEVLTQASVGGLPPQIRQLFVHIIVNCKVTDLKTLWSTYWKNIIITPIFGIFETLMNSVLLIMLIKKTFHATL
ncbi:hypothetical protein AgCh_035710 [Apium graveolens]